MFMIILLGMAVSNVLNAEEKEMVMSASQLC